MMSLAWWKEHGQIRGFEQFFFRNPRIQSFQHHCKGGDKSLQGARKIRLHTSLQRQ